MAPRVLLLSGLLLLSGCLWHVREKVDSAVWDLAGRPFDLAPPGPPEPPPTPPAGKEAPAAPRDGPAPGKKPAVVLLSTDVQTTALMQAGPEPDKPDKPDGGSPRLDLTIPPEIPGSEAPRVKLPDDRAARLREIKRLFPPLPPLPPEPRPLPGPAGQPYTLADLQQLAAANSPTLRQAAADVESARGALIQARTYPNPTVGYESTPSNDGSTAAAQGFWIDQVIKTGGKLKLAAAAAQMDLRNAELALKRARSDLSTAVRSAYYGLLVARETMLVNRGVARFTDEIYRLQAEILGGGFVAPYEPTALRGLAYTARLAYQQSISSYIYAWKTLVAAVGLRQLPLSEVAGRVDRLIPYFDYDTVLAHVLRNHTDVLTARNTLEKARYNLKLAQVTPVPDVEIRADLLKEFALMPFQYVNTVSVSIPFPIWDQNKGNIIAAEGALVRASEESHRVELALTSTLATNYLAYQNNLKALDYYRRHILPDQVRTYRGVWARRRVDINVAFADLVTAQQTLTSSVATYLGILGSLWSSAVSVADQLQTDDLFALARPMALPGLPDVESLPGWPCHHPCLPPTLAHSLGPTLPALAPVPGRPATSPDSSAPRPTPPPADPTLPAPRPIGDSAAPGRPATPPPLSQEPAPPPLAERVLPALTEPLPGTRPAPERRTPAGAP
jgi:cobalt-zinc-cadmium efflux system outer membrane protein